MKRLILLCLIAAACTDNNDNSTAQNSQKIQVTNETLFESSQTVDLGIKESVVSKKNQAIEFEILSDSRCPSAVTCIWEGEVTAKITIQDSQESKIIVVLKPGEFKEVTIDNQQFIVKLVSVVPYPVDGPINKKDYRIELEISPV